MEACRRFGPAGPKDADQLGFLKTRRQDSRAQSRIHGMYERCARYPAPDFYDHGSFRQDCAAKPPFVSGKQLLQIVVQNRGRDFARDPDFVESFGLRVEQCQRSPRKTR